MIFYIKKNKLILFIIILSIIVRIVGLVPGHNYYHPDEPMSYGSATDMFKHGNLNPGRFDYPAGVPLLHYLFYSYFILPVVYFKLFFFHPKMLLTAIIDRDFIAQFSVLIFGPRELYALFWSRFLTAILGIGSVCLVYIIGNKLFGKIAGLAGAFFLVFNYRHVLSSHLALSDIPNSFFAFLSFYVSLLLLEKNTKKRYLLAGLCVGLSFSMKYQILALFPLLFAHIFWVYKSKKISYFFNKSFIASLLLIPLVFCILNPYFLLNLKIALDRVNYVALRYGAGSYRFNFYPLFYLFHWGIGELAFISIILGLILAFFKSIFKSVFLLTYVGPFLFIFLYYMLGGSFIRNFTTVMPFFALYFGLFFSISLSAISRIIPKNMIWFFAVILLIILNESSIKNTFLLDINYNKPWNRDVLQAWGEKNLPSNIKIKVDNLSLSESQNKIFNLVGWNPYEENSIADFRQESYDFVVLDTSWHHDFMLWFDMPANQLINYSGIPYDVENDSYLGLSLMEFKTYTMK